MRLAMEIPTAHLAEVSPLCDVDFALAHMVLENPRHEQFYKAQSDAGREVILDNSFHELGHPLSPVELRLAARKINPSVVVAPDKLGAVDWNWQQVQETQQIIGTEFSVGAVVCGHDYSQRFSYVDACLHRGVQWFFWPFKELRHNWLLELWPSFPQLARRRHHLLGVSTFRELQVCAAFFRSKNILVSYDTAKPIKFGRAKQRFHPGIELRGKGLLKMDDVLTEEELAHTFYNVAYIRRCDA